MMRWLIVALGAAVVLLLCADFLAFHDLFEPHPVRDWLVLAASALAVGCLALVAAGRLRTPGRSG